MSVAYQTEHVTVRLGDALAVVSDLPDASVDCIVSSPPYWSLRDYGIDGQMGLERTPEEWVAALVAVFRECRRVLRPTGTLWLNVGDSYAQGGMGGGGSFQMVSRTREKNTAAKWSQRRSAATGYKPKDLIGAPWMLANALRVDGWYLRAEIIWEKPDAFPESVRDRPTRSHEQVFLLSKSERYFYDADAISEPVSPITHARIAQNVAAQVGSWRANGGSKTNGPMKAVVRAPKMAEPGQGIRNNTSMSNALSLPVTRRNARTVWRIDTGGYAEAHFATFPEDLAERCILAGTSAIGGCPECAAPWSRETDTAYVNPGNRTNNGRKNNSARIHGGASFASGVRREKRVTTTGWAPTCEHDLDPIPAVVLDPFAGSGTTLQVAARLGRKAIGVELNPAYVRLIEHRVAAGEYARSRSAVDLPLVAASVSALGPLFQERERERERHEAGCRG